MKKAIRWILIIVGGLLLTVGLTALLLYRATQQVPPFYAELLKAEPAQQVEAGEKFEKAALGLNQSVRRPGDWEAHFTAAEINGWLANQLPQKMPTLLPPEIQDPRVSIDPQQMQIACRYSLSGNTSVLVLGVTPFVTDRPFEIAIRVRQARVGALPIPLKKLLEQVSHRSAAAKVPLRWTEQAGDPVAILTLPAEHPDIQGRLLRPEKIELREGELVISGRTEYAPE